MKKVYTLLLMLFVAGGLMAQKPSYYKKAELDMNIEQNAFYKTQIIDTIETYLFRASSAIIYSSQDGGYVFGTGYFDNMGTVIPVTDATGNHYDGVPNARVIEVLTWFAFADVVGSAGTVKGQVFAVGSDTLPTQLLGEGTVTTSDLTAATSFTYSSIAITNGTGDTQGNAFLVAVEYSQIGDDTLGIVSSNADSADGAGELRTRQLTSSSFGGAWVAADALWGGFNCDAFIVPVIDDNPTNIGQAVNSKGLVLGGNFPNPATTTSTIRFSIDKPQEVSIKVFDLAGREILNTGMQEMAAGQHDITVDVTQKPAGAYYYTISTEETSLTSKLNVVK